MNKNTPLSYFSNDSSTAKNSILTIFIHGYGANGTDLQPVLNLLPILNQSTWILPQAPKQILQLNNGYEWFPIDFDKLYSAYRANNFLKVWEDIPTNFLSNIEQLSDLILEKISNHTAIVIGGFSQGAMCATHLVRMYKFPIPTYLINFSGGICCQNILSNGSNQPISFFHSHGKSDDLIPIKSAYQIKDNFSLWNWKGQHHFFEGGHEIDMSTINALNRWLEENFS